MAQTGMGADPAIAADRHALPDGYKGSDAAAGADLRSSVDYNVRADFRGGVHLCV